jgi:hypothetical protein
MIYALLIVLAADASGFARVSWHASRTACESQAQVEMLHLAVTARAVEHVECRPYAAPRLRPITGEALR